MIMVAFTHPSATRQKDTCANIKATKQFSMNIIVGLFSLCYPEFTIDEIIVAVGALYRSCQLHLHRRAGFGFGMGACRPHPSEIDPYCSSSSWRSCVLYGMRAWSAHSLEHKSPLLTLHHSSSSEMFHDMFDQNDSSIMSGTMVLGRVKLFHVRDDIIDENLLVDTAKLQPVSRLGGISYGRTTNLYELPRPVWKSEQEREEVKAALAR